jgi:2-polyprenyl-3-methyl-5-hydroxy-6-metoxy-1,4-benzoquinol methylase
MKTIVPKTSAIKDFVKGRLPLAASVYRNARSYWYSRQWAGQSAKSVFAAIYKDRVWGDADSSSGTGSSLAQTCHLRGLLPNILLSLEVKSLLDAPCGDFHWMRMVNLPITSYVGVDVVEELIMHDQVRYSKQGVNFQCANLMTDPVPKSDLVFCRDCLVHLSYKDIRAVLRNFKMSGSKYFLTTTYPRHSFNVDCYTGHWRPLNLQRPPFSFSEPIKIWYEHCTEAPEFEDKALGLWEFDSLSGK